jgi:hypothetical protein
MFRHEFDELFIPTPNSVISTSFIQIGSLFERVCA